MRLHCHQVSRRPNMTTDRTPLLMDHIDPGIGPNISICVQGVDFMCVENILLTYECN